MKKPGKQQIIQVLKSKFDKASITVLLQNKGLSVAEFTDLRKKLRAGNVDVKVSKNTLTKIAVNDTTYSVLSDYYKGPTFTLWAYQDPVGLAKTLSAFLKDQPKASFVAGAIGSRTINQVELGKLATLPSREELIAKMLGSMNAPVTNFVNVLAAVPRSFLNVLNAVKDKKTS